MEKILNFLIIVTFSVQLFAQQNTLTKERAVRFIEEMIIDSDSLETFVLPEELAISKRLGIEYEGIKNKFLISYEIPVEIQESITNGSVNYSITTESIDNQFSILQFECASKHYKTKYYFKNGYLISPLYFYYKDWQKIESDHFIFYVSQPNFFNQYSIDKLEEFIQSIFSVLKYTEEEKEFLKKDKLIYILCKDEDEIEKLTGYKARGMSNLAYDYVITTYNCHYHELLHILINFKLQKLPLYTHPFLQEGFAVAFGGRGGYEPGIILNLGKFLEQSEFLKFTQLLNVDEYKTYDVSMSYPLCGLYSLFLINETEIENYLKLYLKYSSKNLYASVIDSTQLLSGVKWNSFVNNFSNNQEIRIDISDENFETLIEDSSFTLKGNKEFYLFETKVNIIISTKDKPKDYISKVFKENYLAKNYESEKYLIRINESEVAVYNLFTNNLIANYVSGFTTNMKPVPNENGYYKFLINRTIFDEQPKEWVIKTKE